MRIQYALLLTSCLLCYGLAKPATVFLGYQDSLGQYSFGYSAPGSARSEVRTLNGATKGAYSYVDGSGNIQSAQYVADSEHGFRVVATNLPEAPLPVQETPEVAAARIAHLQALEIAQQNGQSSSEPENEIQAKSSSTDQNVSEADKKQPEIPKDILAKSVEGSKEAIEVTAAKSSQSVIDSPIPAVRVIPSHVVLPQIISQPTVPIFRVAQGNHEIEPSSLEESLKAQASSITPAGTALKSGENVESAGTRQAGENSKAQEKEESLKTIIAPVNVIPLSSSYSNFVRYAPALRYVTYTIL